MAVLHEGMDFDRMAMDSLRIHERTPNTEPNRSALHAAAASGDPRRVARAAALAPDLDAHDADGWTALHLAACAGHVRAVAALLGSGARAETRSRCPGGFDGCTALHLAVSGGHLEAARLLLQAGADPDARDECGYTSLHLASERGERDVVRLLLKAGARVEATVCDHTPLALARRGHHMEAAALIEMVGGKL